MRQHLRRHAPLLLTLLVILLFAPAAAHAGGGGGTMPWDGPLQAFINALTGGTAKLFGILAFVVSGALMAFTEMSEGLKRLVQAIFGVSLMIFAANVMSAIGLGGAVL